MTTTKELMNELKIMRQEIASIKASSERMDRHIFFIDSVYGHVRPLIDFLNTRMLGLVGQAPTPVLEIEYKKDEKKFQPPRMAFFIGVAGTALFLLRRNLFRT